jgi:hypothetical protein
MSTNGGAGLLELVARGKKDVFFTGEPKISFFHSVYARASPWLRETRYILPRNDANFGTYVDFVLDPVADLMRDIHLLVDLPTWLPADIAALNGNSLVTDLSGNTYGYTNNIGYYLIEKVQLFQHQAMIYEDFGEAMLLRRISKSRRGQMELHEKVSGGHNGSALAIQRAATPKQLTIRLSLPFDSGERVTGIPVGAIQSFSLRLRIFLRSFKSLVECSDNRIRPSPFDISMLIKTGPQALPRQFRTKNISDLGKPTIQLRVQHVYVDGISQKILKDTKWTIPYLKAQLNEFTLEETIWKSPSQIRKELEIYGSSQRLRILFQSEANILAGKLSDYSPISGKIWFTSCGLRVHGFDRVGVWESDVFEKVTSYSHDRGQYVPNVFLLDSGCEDESVPAGTLNFAAIDKPELQVMLVSQPADVRSGSKKSFMRVYADLWDVLILENQWIKSPYS